LSKIEDIKKERQLARSKLLALKSKVYEKFLEMEQATYIDGALKKKEKELIAIGISIIIKCESCMQWHITEAAKSGATSQEILEAIDWVLNSYKKKGLMINLDQNNYYFVNEKLAKEVEKGTVNDLLSKLINERLDDPKKPIITRKRLLARLFSNIPSIVKKYSVSKTAENGGNR